MQREYLRFFLRKQEGYYSFYKVAHSLPKSISYFSSSKCKISTSRYENSASRSGGSNVKLELKFFWFNKGYVISEIYVVGTY